MLIFCFSTLVFFVFHSWLTFGFDVEFKETLDFFSNNWIWFSSIEFKYSSWFLSLDLNTRISFFKVPGKWFLQHCFDTFANLTFPLLDFHYSNFFSCLISDSWCCDNFSISPISSTHSFSIYVLDLHCIDVSGSNFFYSFFFDLPFWISMVFWFTLIIFHRDSISNLFILILFLYTFMDFHGVLIYPYPFELLTPPVLLHLIMLGFWFPSKYFCRDFGFHCSATVLELQITL